MAYAAVLVAGEAGEAINGRAVVVYRRGVVLLYRLGGLCRRRWMKEGLDGLDEDGGECGASEGSGDGGLGVEIGGEAGVDADGFHGRIVQALGCLYNPGWRRA